MDLESKLCAVRLAGWAPLDLNRNEALEVARVFEPEVVLLDIGLPELNGYEVLAQMKAALGSLDRVERVVKLGVFVNSAPSFTDQPKVANGASELMQEVFGEAGRHARSAVGVAVLPLGVAVEVDAIVAVKP